MAHGRPDWGITNAPKTTFQSSDAGELAVRLGSPDSFDRRGDVVWWDDFECGIAKWTTFLDGNGGSVAISTVQARNGQNSALITCAIGAGNTDEIAHYQPIAVRSRLGLEVSFLVDGSPASIDIMPEQFDNGGTYDLRIRVDVANSRLQYWDSTGAWVTFYTFPITTYFSPPLFHTLKLVWDSNTHQYVRVLFNDLAFDLSGIPVSTLGAGTTIMVQYVVSVNGHAAHKATVYVDDVILTQNE